MNTCFFLEQDSGVIRRVTTFHNEDVTSYESNKNFKKIKGVGRRKIWILTNSSGSNCSTVKENFHIMGLNNEVVQTVMLLPKSNSN
jgi:hypothetical protein